ncbi:MULTISPECIES: PQQ-binding-like beta-propeller repeat protein [unclassified Streptomyces]|uniref:outer membrane protein assembly factor BamB family protein n=1 Tax=unclassified Streptomyces TaxID=2593676 RepID=UPI00278C0897|nr:MULTISPECIES: PQQ-binding-like beta-propeller repeat protein [unclassified Streptomyces]
MNADQHTDQLDRTLRDTLQAWAPDATGPAPAGLADRLVRRRRRRTALRVAGAALGLTAVAFGTVLVTDPGGGEPSPAHHVSREGKLRWQTTLPGKTTWDACAMGPGAVYCRGAGYDGIGVDTRTGKVVWQREAERKGDGGTPAGSVTGVRDGILYSYADHAPGTSNPRTDLVAVDLDSHKVLWKQKLADDSRDADSAVLFDGGVLANTPTFKSAAALDPKTGRTLWTYKWKRADCSAVAIGGVPYLTCSPDSEKAPQRSTVVRLDPRTGRPHTVATVAGMTYAIGRDGDTVLLARLAGKQDHVGEPGPVDLIRVDTGTGKVTRHRADGPRGGVIADGVMLTVRSDGTALAWSATNGKQLWASPTGLRLRKDPTGPDTYELASPAAVNLPDRVAYFLDPTGNLVGLDLDNGTVRWRGKADLPEQPLLGGVFPQLMTEGRHGLIGQTGDALFRIDPKPTPRSGS